MLDQWPTPTDVHVAVRERLALVLDEHGGPVAEVGRRTLGAAHGVLSDQPHSLTAVLVPGACVTAGGSWRAALWPAAAAELMMAAADLFDDVADADPGAASIEHPAVVLTAAAGLLSLAGLAVVRVIDDGVSAETGVALAQLLGHEFARAANGQAVSLMPAPQPVDALSAYHQAAAKSGPLGSLIARLGARTASDDARIVDMLGEFGRRLAVYSQLLNDARDAAPGAAQHKADIRTGTHTVPLAFTGSRGAPPGLDGEALEAWEEAERARILAGGGLAAAHALAEAERLRAGALLDVLEGMGRSVVGLRALVQQGFHIAQSG
jgi:geranylgeranyl pyrophosphate synthase